ncbi:hypothetical protein [Actinomycetospora straminea]|uniref:Uncharacterized protein n=1 Tax=Actinomycetospora straminea TaxID=663607 RepID=A0ABP9F6S9_9PSEU|nr:hypothetical protein [Actinomycetospora straminea]MDD7936560.1 hypothetical protein [Actinomycetospora straminea]
MTAAEQAETRAQQRAREAAERAEWDRLTARLGVLWPTYDCFCGTLDDLRRTVDDLERKAGIPPTQRTTPPGSVRREGDPADHARMATAHAAQRVSGDLDQDQNRRQQLVSWHAADRGHELRADDAVAE